MTTLIPKFDLKDGGATPTGAINRPINEKLAEVISLADFGAIGDGTTDDTVAIQNAIDYLATFTSGTITAPPDATYKITDTIDFSVLGNVTEWYNLDFNGAIFIWYGSQVGGDRMWYFFNNKSLNIKNFTLQCNPTIAISATVKGIFIDSLQPDGSGLLTFSSFKIRLANIGMELGSFGIDQNRVSDAIFQDFLFEGCTYGVSVNSGNVDNVLFTCGIFSGCTDGGFWLQRSGYIQINNCNGYACDPFILVDGPIGVLNVISCQSEQGGLSNPAFFYRKNYESARIHPINFIGCAIDNKFWLDYDAGIGSDVQTVNFSGCYIREFLCDCPDTTINMFGSVQTAGYTMTVGGANTKLFTYGTRLEGTVTYNVNAQREPLYTNNLGITPILTGAGLQKGYIGAGTSSIEIVGDTGISIDLGSSGALNNKVKSNGAFNFVPKTTPSTPSAGDTYYDSGTNKLRCYNGSTWNDLF
jgi:hypothetical protein